MNVRQPRDRTLTPDMLLQERYQVLRQLGQGGFSQTYEVCDRATGTTKVLKVLTNSYPKAVDLFQREAKVLIELDHPGIPSVEPDGYLPLTELDSDQPPPGLVMEKIPGQDLQQWMASRAYQPITQPLAVDWLRQLSEILQQLHHRHYFHRDIKPSNIMLTPTGQLVLIDFGGVREITDTFLRQQEGDRTGTRLASRGYAPLEQIDGRAVPQSDFFALGRTLVYLLTGRPPTDFDAHPETGVLDWSRADPTISQSLVDLINWLMAPFPGQRPQTAAMILAAIATIEQLPPHCALPRPQAALRSSRPAASDSNPAEWSILASLSGETSATETSLISELPDSTSPSHIETQLPVAAPSPWQKAIQTAVVGSITTGLVIGARLLGILQPLEIQAFDQFLRWRPAEPIDERMLIVEVTETDVDQLGGEYPLHDDTMLELLQKLDAHNPAMIGIDIYRDRAEGEGRADLTRYLQQQSHIIPVCAHPAADTMPNGIAGPPDIDSNQLGFVDVALDQDSIVRRHLVAADPGATSPCTAAYALSSQLAFSYLANQGYTLSFPSTTNWQIETEDGVAAQFHALQARPGFYVADDTRGYQLLHNYRYQDGFRATLPSVTLSELLQDQVDPALIQDKIVLIGMTDPAIQDNFRTPYGQDIRGLLLQASFTSQLVGHVLEGRILLQFWPLWLDLLCIAGAAFMGAALMQLRLSRRLLLILIGSSLIAFSGISWLSLWLIGVVLPLLPASGALLLSSGGIAALASLNTRRI